MLTVWLADSSMCEAQMFTCVWSTFTTDVGPLFICPSKTKSYVTLGDKFWYTRTQMCAHMHAHRHSHNGQTSTNTNSNAALLFFFFYFGVIGYNRVYRNGCIDMFKVLLFLCLKLFFLLKTGPRWCSLWTVFVKPSAHFEATVDAFCGCYQQMPINVSTY